MSPRIGLDINTLLHVATELANKEGLEAVTLASLAKRLNIRPPSLYNHIDGLDDLRKHLAIYGFKQLHACLESAVVGRTGDEAVFMVAEAYVSIVRKNPGLYEATLLAANQWDEEVQLAGKRIVDLTVNILQAYNLVEEETIHIVRGFRSILHGFTSLEQKGGFGLPLDLDKSFRLMITTFLAGIHTMKRESGIDK